MLVSHKQCLKAGQAVEGGRQPPECWRWHMLACCHTLCCTSTLLLVRIMAAVRTVAIMQAVGGIAVLLGPMAPQIGRSPAEAGSGQRQRRC